MHFQQLEYVLTIAREGSLASAAKKLFLTPSALSQHISRLEQELQTPLFTRGSSGWTPTRAGQIYLDMATDILERQKNAYAQINDITGTSRRHFTVGVNPGRGIAMFSAVFPIFKEMYPDIDVSLMQGTVVEINNMILAGQVDIGFVTNILGHHAISTRTLATEEILLAVPRKHPMAALADNVVPGELPTVSLDAFKQDAFLMAGAGTPLRALEDRMFDQAGFPPKILFETPSLETLHLLSKSGYGVSFIPRYYADSTENAVYFHTIPTARWELIAAYQKDHYISAPEEEIIKLASHYYTQHI